MRYQKPVVMELGSRTRQAKGQDPLACINGTAASGQMICETGSDGFAAYLTDCLAGTAPTGYAYTACIAGGSATWECSAGGGASWNWTCATGPAAA